MYVVQLRSHALNFDIPRSLFTHAGERVRLGRGSGWRSISALGRSQDRDNEKYR